MKLSAKTIIAGIAIVLLYIYAFPLALMLTFVFFIKTGRGNWIVRLIWLLMFLAMFVAFPLLHK